MCVIFVSRCGIKNNALATVIITVTAKAKITAMTKLMVQFVFQSTFQSIKTPERVYQYLRLWGFLGIKIEYRGEGALFWPYFCFAWQ